VRRRAPSCKLSSRRGDQAFDPKHLDARCSEFDSQRQAVKPAANLNYRRGIRIGQREVFDDRSHALNEQLHGGKAAASAAVSLDDACGLPSGARR